MIQFSSAGAAAGVRDVQKRGCEFRSAWRIGRREGMYGIVPID